MAGEAPAQVRMSEAPRLLRLPEKERSSVDRTTTQSKTEAVGLGLRSPSGRIALGRKRLKYFSNKFGKKVPTWESLSTEQSQLFLSVHVDDTKMVGKGDVGTNVEISSQRS